MRIATWNVNGVRAREAQLAEFIQREQPDVLCLQEIKAAVDQLPQWMIEVDGYWCRWHGAKGYSGVALLIRKAAVPDQPPFSHPDFDHENRIVTARVPGLTVASAYVPNGGKDYAAKLRFLESLDAWAARLAAGGERLVLCGDINVARTDLDVHPKERKAGAIGQRADERAIVERLISRELVDVHRALHPDDDGLFTWWAPWRNLRARNIGWRIDMILASRTLTARSCVAQREFGSSDHAPLVAELTLP
ncbi:MAG: exodeoxyribonuclease III [Gemmatimonadaceae bacterium]|nr:exodeoxyribonuclease III [Gemmatimonadaceae bacterium]